MKGENPPPVTSPPVTSPPVTSPPVTSPPVDPPIPRFESVDTSGTVPAPSSFMDENCLGFRPVGHPFPPNKCMGVVAKTQSEVDDRVSRLLFRKIEGIQVRFLLLDPLKERVWLDNDWFGPKDQGELLDVVELGHSPSLYGLNWVIVGGGDQPLHPFWVNSLLRQCQARQVPFFFKGWGRWIPRGRLYDHLPLPVDNDRTLIFNVNGNRRGRAVGSLTNHLCEFSDGSPCEVMEAVDGDDPARFLLNGRRWEEVPACLMPTP